MFTDVVLPRRVTLCNATLGYAECLSGRCYLADRKCDGHFDCDDGTDEALCMFNYKVLLRTLFVLNNLCFLSPSTFYD